MNRNIGGVIHSAEAYSKTMVLQRLGISQRFWDKLLEEGLPYATIGHTRWVTGHNLIVHLENHSHTKSDEAE